MFREEVVAHVYNRLEGEVLLLPKLSHRLITAVIILWLALVIVLLFNGQFSRKETVQGWLTSPVGVVRVFNPSQNSVVSEISVTNGQIVKKGDALISLKKLTNLSSGEELSQSLIAQLKKRKWSLTEKRQRLILEYAERKASLNAQLRLSESELKNLSSQLTTVTKHEAITQNEFDRYQKLSAQGMISSVQLNKTSKELFTIQSNKQALQRSKSQQESTLSKLKTEIELLPAKKQDAVSDIDTQINDVAQQVLQAKSQHEFVIKSPADGVINNLQISAGQRISNNIPFLNIAPEDSTLTVKLMVTARAAGFLEVGQTINVSYSAFPYQKFGIYKANVTAIPNTVMLPNEILDLPIEAKEAAYIVSAELESNKITAYGKEIQLKNGMTLTADVLLSKRTIIEWLLEPIYSLTGKMQ